MPAANLSEQISTAGTEASGTGNMKFALNGALTIGTWDGANIEIAEHVGLDNIFIFGNRTDQVAELRAHGYQPRRYYDDNYELKTAIDRIADYQLLADYDDNVRTQRRVDDLYRRPSEWARQTILNIAAMGSFSSDRIIREYADEIWGVQPLFGNQPAT